MRISLGVNKNGQQGFGLVEIMVAMLIGILVVGGLAKIFLGNKHAYRVQAAQGRLQENARLASVYLSTNIGRAGFHQNPFEDPNAIFAGANFAIGGENDNTDTTDQILDGADTLTIQFEGNGLLTDCMGTTVAAGTLSKNDYKINTRNELACNSNTGSGFQSVIDNVMNMQILYGLDTNADRSVDQYVNSATVGASFINVLSVHVSLLFASTQDVKSKSETKTYTLLDTSITSPTDRIQRRVVERVISLRNRLL